MEFNRIFIYDGISWNGFMDHCLKYFQKLMRNIFDDDEVYKSNHNNMLNWNKSETLKQQNSSKLNSNLFEDL